MTELDARVAAGDPQAMVESAIALAKDGDLAAARTLLDRSAELGHTGALFVRGVVEESAGNAEAGIGWYVRAAQAGDADAMFNLGVSAAENGQEEIADAWLRQAAEAGSTKAAFNLGARAQNAGSPAEAEQWYGLAAQAGQPEAMAALAALLAGRGEYEQSAAWHNRAFAAGPADPEAMYLHGRVLEQLGQATQARPYLLRAATVKQAGASAALGDLARAGGDLVEAEYWYTVSAESGEAAGFYGLGLALADQGDFDRAETATRRAADLGSPQAMNMLGGLEETRGNRQESLAWYTRAAEAGLAQAATNRERVAGQAMESSGAAEVQQRAQGAQVPGQGREQSPAVPEQAAAPAIEPMTNTAAGPSGMDQSADAIGQAELARGGYGEPRRHHVPGQTDAHDEPSGHENPAHSAEHSQNNLNAAQEQPGSARAAGPGGGQGLTDESTRSGGRDAPIERPEPAASPAASFGAFGSAAATGLRYTPGSGLAIGLGSA
ncbi:MAG TPA: tetratricopeptide repeat protein [Actinocrinis sp.]|nr:tetratricopeptide repeat protein [Actinocrinis sp.]